MSEALSDEELAAIRERQRNRGAGIDIPTLLDEVDRLRAENARLAKMRPIVEAVARQEPWWRNYNTAHLICPFCYMEIAVPGYNAASNIENARESIEAIRAALRDAKAEIAHAPDCPVEQARAALAKEGEG